MWQLLDMPNFFILKAMHIVKLKLAFCDSFLSNVKFLKTMSV